MPGSEDDSRPGFSAFNEKRSAGQICQRMHGVNMPAFIYVAEGSRYKTMKGYKFCRRAVVAQEMRTQGLLTGTVCGGEERSGGRVLYMFLLAPILYMYSRNVLIWCLLLLVKTWFHGHFSV